MDGRRSTCNRGNGRGLRIELSVDSIEGNFVGKITIGLLELRKTFGKMGWVINF